MCLYDDTLSAKNPKAYQLLKPAKYFVKCTENHEYPLIFAGIPHILVKSKIPIELAEVIEYDGE